MKTRLLTLVVLLAVACDGNDTTPLANDSNVQLPTPTPAGSSAGATAMTAGAGGAHAAKPAEAGAQSPAAQTPEAFGADSDLVPWSTDEFTVEAGQERYLCFAKTLEQDLVINGYASKVKPFVHHLILARTRTPEPEGFAECDVAFRASWDTLFISGAGDTKLEFPADAGHRLPKGTQVLVQMHLLNLTEEAVKGAVLINMRRSSIADPRPVSSYIFGTAAVELPAASTSQVVGTCSARQSVQLIAGFPHMHMLGSSLRFEVGKSKDALQEVFKRDPFDFDNQRIDKLELTIAPGEVTRVTCEFDNTTTERVMYGESTKNEMCYFVGFAVDQAQQSACLEVLPPFVFGR